MRNLIVVKTYLEQNKDKVFGGVVRTYSKTGTPAGFDYAVFTRDLVEFVKKFESILVAILPDALLVNGTTPEGMIEVIHFYPLTEEQYKFSNVDDEFYPATDRIVDSLKNEKQGEL